MKQNQGCFFFPPRCPWPARAGALCDWKRAGCLEGLVMNGPSAQLPVTLRILFPFPVLFLLLVTNLCWAWHPSECSHKELGSLLDLGAEDWGIVPVSPVIVCFNNSHFLIFPWETGSLLKKTPVGGKECGLQIALFGQNSPRARARGALIHTR